MFFVSRQARVSSCCTSTWFSHLAPPSLRYDGFYYQPLEPQLSLDERRSGMVSVSWTQFPPNSVTIAKTLCVPCGESGFLHAHPGGREACGTISASLCRLRAGCPLLLPCSTFVTVLQRRWPVLAPVAATEAAAHSRCGSDRRCGDRDARVAAAPPLLPRCPHAG